MADGCGAHHFPKIDQNYMWNNSHRIPTECWQKMSCNQSCKKNHHGTAWNERKIKEIRMGPVALGSSCAGERFLLPSPWEPPSVAGKSNQTAKLRGSEESATASLQQAGQTERD